MSEQELRAGLLAAVAGEPALAFDPDVLIARARREIQRRRALIGAGTATVAVAVAAVAVPTLLGSPRHGGSNAGYGAGWPGETCAVTPQPPAEPSGKMIIPSEPDVSYRVKVTEPSGKPTLSSIPGTTTVKPPPKPSAPPEPTGKPCQLSGKPSTTPLPPKGPATPPSGPPSSPRPALHTAEQLKKRGEEMRTRLRDSFAKVVPEATDTTVDEFGGEATGAISDGQNYLDTFIHYTVKGVRSAVDITVFAPGAGPSSTAEICAQATCSFRDGKDASKFVIAERVLEGKATILSVSNHRSGEGVVRASGYNYDPTAQEGSRQGLAMPVSVEQLMALAGDSELWL